MEVNIIDILRFLLVIIPLIFASIVITEKHISKKILGLQLLNIALYYSIFIYLLNNFSILGVIFHSFWFFAIIPFWFLYTKSLILFPFIWQKKYLIHFSPSFLALFFFITIYFIDRIYVINLVVINHYYYYIAVSIYTLQVLLYCFLIIKLFRFHKSNIKEYFSTYHHKNNLLWLKLLLIFYFFIIFFELSLTIIDQQFYKKFIFGIQADIVFSFLTAIKIFIISYFGVKQKAIYKSHADQHELLNKEVTSTKTSNIKPEQKQNIDTKSIYNKILKYIKNEKLFKNPNLSLFSIAKKIGINRTYISLSIKEETGDNFYSLINNMRIEEAKEMIKNDYLTKHSIEYISKDVGFKSRATFYSWFKKKTGHTPIKYENAVKNNNLSSNI